MPLIEGASPEQRAILEEILAGLSNTRMRELRVKQEYDLEPERDEHDNPQPDWDPTTPLDDALWLVDPPHPDLRAEWELELVGAAFHLASAKAGLTQVVAAFSQRGRTCTRRSVASSNTPRGEASRTSADSSGRRLYRPRGNRFAGSRVRGSVGCRRTRS